MVEEYHDPDPFRYNLNAFLQSLRSVTLYLQSEGSDADAFPAWYEGEQDGMRGDALLRRFLEGRNVIVHKGPLAGVSWLVEVCAVFMLVGGCFWGGWCIT